LNLLGRGGFERIFKNPHPKSLSLMERDFQSRS
jgi:hypothetical protein